MGNPSVTIVVVPRERFSVTRLSLEALYQHTDPPFHLIYVDGGSPAPVRRYLERQAQERGFDLLRAGGYLAPQRARNLALPRIHTTYVVFMDNDVVVGPGWLAALLRCAEETNATVVSPLICESMPLHSIIHFAGGDAHIDVVEREGRVERHLVETILRQGQRVADVRHELHRGRTEVAEFHCMLIRASVFDRVGPFDEGLLTIRENVDFCMRVAESGGTVYLEPASLVTYAAYHPLTLSDVPYYLLRWNDRWTLRTLHHLREKWRLTEDDYFRRQYSRTFLEWRRRSFLIQATLLRWIPSWRVRLKLEKGLSPLMTWAANVSAARHARRAERVQLISPRTEQSGRVPSKSERTTRP
jgi:GT2 family glycosyltransferase